VQNRGMAAPCQATGPTRPRQDSTRRRRTPGRSRLLPSDRSRLNTNSTPPTPPEPAHQTNMHPSILISADGTPSPFPRTAHHPCRLCTAHCCSPNRLIDTDTALHTAVHDPTLLFHRDHHETTVGFHPKLETSPINPATAVPSDCDCIRTP
jgi:hypothetical protein